MWVSRRIEKFFCAKRPAARRTRVADTVVRVGVECGARGKVSSHRGRVMVPADLRRYHRLLLKKQRGVSSAPGEAQSRSPAAGGLEGDLIDQANADEEAELQIHLHQTEGRLARAIEEALVRIKKRTYGVCEACGHPISRDTRYLLSDRCHWDCFRNVCWSLEASWV